MEEEKAAAYYDELTRKGEGAARFKQGLGFTSSRDAAGDGVPARGSAVPSPSSFLGSFVRASSPTKVSVFQKQKQLENIQDKLKKKFPHEEKLHGVSDRGDSSMQRDRCEGHSRRHSRRRSRSRDRRRDRSLSRDGDRDRRRGGERSDRRSRSRSPSNEDRGLQRGRGRSPSRLLLRERRLDRSEEDDRGKAGAAKAGKGRNVPVDYSRSIEGYDKMSAAERVKAKMKLQLSETAKRDASIGTGSGWERFEFDKDAPLDSEEVEAAEDDKMVVKQMGQSFRFSAVEAREEEKIKVAHDEAMFGASTLPLSSFPYSAKQIEGEEKETKETDRSLSVSNIISDELLLKQRGSWRDRARKVALG